MLLFKNTSRFSERATNEHPNRVFRHFLFFFRYCYALVSEKIHHFRLDEETVRLLWVLFCFSMTMEQRGENNDETFEWMSTTFCDYPIHELIWTLYQKSWFLSRSKIVTVEKSAKILFAYDSSRFVMFGFVLLVV